MDASTPLVSVIVPTYNRLPLLRETIASVQAQTYPHWELIVVDDGSTDGTAEHVRGIEDLRVRLVEIPHGGNPARARNAGAAVARGDYLTFLDHDDLFLPPKLEAQLAAMRNAGVRWSYAQFDHCDEHGQPIATDLPSFWRPVSGRIALEIAREQSMATLMGVVMERGLFEETGRFDESPRLAWRDDADLVLRMAMHTDTVAVSGVLAYNREHGDRTVRRIDPAAFQVAKAAVYQKALSVARDPVLRRALRRSLSIRLAEAGAYRWHKRAWISGAICFTRSALLRPPLRRWGAAVARGLGLKAWPELAFTHRVQPGGHSSSTPATPRTAAPGR